jgi:hypothetical protein
MAFEKVKLRGKTEIDFNGFKRAVQEICQIKKVPYGELANSAMLQLELMKGTDSPRPQQHAQHTDQRQDPSAPMKTDMDTNTIMQLVFKHYKSSNVDSLGKDNWCVFVSPLFCAFSVLEIRLAANTHHSSNLFRSQGIVLRRVWIANAQVPGR